MLTKLKRKGYPSDLTESEWELIEKLLPPISEEVNTRKYELREIVNALFYLVRSGCSWRSLPHDFPDWQSVYGYYRKWSKDGTLERLNKELREQLREKLGKDKSPSACIFDSQSVKTTEKGGM